MNNKLKKSFQIVGVSSFLLFSIGGLVITNKVQDVLANTPTITEEMLKSEATSNMFDVEGNLIWSQTNIRRNYIKYKDIPKLYVDLLLNTEDETYFKDGGFSVKGLINAGLSYVKSKFTGEEPRGGSTIEQQLIKNIAFSTDVKDRTIDRKIKELWLAQQLDNNWDKKQILEWYVNKINMGEGSYGANTIAITYYGQDLSSLTDKNPETISKLGIIAGLGQAPSAYNLYDDPTLVKKRRDIVLKLAYDNNVLTKDEYEKALQVDVQFGLKPRFWRNQEINTNVSKHNAYITSVLNQVRELGYDIEKTPIQIHTHLNQGLDSKLQEIVSNPNYYKDEQQQVASTVLDVATGNVIAQAGSRNQSNEEPYAYNRATQRTRSSGSTIKPFIDYGPAIEYLGFGSNYQLDSSPYLYPGTNVYAQNYGGFSYGIVDMKKALRLSLNTPAIRILDNAVGPNRAKSFLSELKMDVGETYAGSEALGLNLSTLDFAQSFAAIASGGMYRPANYIQSLQFADESVKEIKPVEHRAMKESTAYILAKILEGVPQDNGSAPNAKIPEYPGYFVKTGTVGYDVSDGISRPDMVASDSWMSGATKSVAVSVWTGYDSPNENGHWIDANQTTRNDIFVDIMKTFNQDKDVSDWNKPDSVTEFGSGLTADYVPLDLADIKQIAIPEIGTSSNVLHDLGLTSKTTIKPDSTLDKTPKDYQLGSWHKDFKDNDLKLFNQFSSNTNLWPTIKDVIDDKTYTGD